VEQLWNHCVNCDFHYKRNLNNLSLFVSCGTFTTSSNTKSETFQCNWTNMWYCQNEGHKSEHIRRMKNCNFKPQKWFTWSGSIQEDSSVEERPHTEDEHVASLHPLEYHSTSPTFPKIPGFHSTATKMYSKIYYAHFIKSATHRSTYRWTLEDELKISGKICLFSMVPKTI
jgi:hypothetical protein